MYVCILGNKSTKKIKLIENKDNGKSFLLMNNIN